MGMQVRYEADWELYAGAWLAEPLAVSAAEALRRAAEEGDGWLGRLVEALHGGDELAGRVVVQHLLPRLAAMARRDSRLDVDELVGALWLRLVAYPLDRRPSSIASNLVLDARKDVLAERRPLPVTPPSEPRRHGVAARVLADAVSIGVIDARMGEVMSSVYVWGLSGDAAARRHGVTPTTVRWRCSAGMKRLAGARALLA